ncbi:MULTISPECIES: hypothetical protein [unclassified Ruminococcus]|uniref:hypothetical protein n=1 Tax=unclassified Ruminococcus TaxID=2608920 RepID=UPI00093090A9|nr:MULTISPECIES: hypothetical protein [unclassified Ruminococcus]
MTKNKSKSSGYNTARLIWGNIRRFQYINSLTNAQLAEALDVTERTLYSYDKDPSTLTLQRIQRFLDCSGVLMEDLTKI